MRFDPQSTPAAYVSEVTDEQPQRITKDSEVCLAHSMDGRVIHEAPRRQLPC